VIIAKSDELLANAIAVRQQITQETASTYTRSLLLVVVNPAGGINRDSHNWQQFDISADRVDQNGRRNYKRNLSAEAGVHGRDEVGTLAKAIIR